MPQVPAYVYVIAASVLFFLLGWFFFKLRNERLNGQAALVRKRLLDDARKEAGDILKTAQLEAKEEFIQARQRFDRETEKIRGEREGEA